MTKKRGKATARKAAPARKARPPAAKKAGFLVVKRHGHLQEFDPKKLYASVYHACKGSHVSEERSEEIASKVLLRVQAGLRGRKTVGAHELFMLTVRELSRIDSEAGFMYEHHFDIS